MREDIETLLKKEKDFSIQTRGELDDKVIAIDYFQKAKNDISYFDKKSWESKGGYESPNFPSFTKGLENWSAGFYAWAGPPNMGKTAMMLNVMKDLCFHEKNKLFGVYFSLDDSRNKVIPRVVAMNKEIPISVVSKPSLYKDMILEGHPDSLNIQEKLDKREEGLKELMRDSNKMIIYDSQEIKTIDDIVECAKQIQAYVKSIDPEMNIMIAVDSLKDIEPDQSYGKLTVNEKIDVVSKSLKDLSICLDCILFASMHLRKLNANRRPTMDDLRDSNTLEYELDACFLIYNDVSKNKQSAKIYYREEAESTEKMPIIEVDWGKNKISSYKGVTFCNFAPNYSKCIECNEESATRYSALIYEL